MRRNESESGRTNKRTLVNATVIVHVSMNVNTITSSYEKPHGHKTQLNNDYSNPILKMYNKKFFFRMRSLQQITKKKKKKKKRGGRKDLSRILSADHTCFVESLVANISKNSTLLRLQSFILWN